jgi:hypothetical protein
MLLQLSSNAPLTNKIQIGCLPTSKSTSYPPLSFSAAYVAGWGHTQFQGSASNVLKNVKLNLYEPVYCVNASVEYLKNETAEFDWNKEICAGSLKGGEVS